MVSFIDAHRHRWPVAPMCTAIELPERTYYAAKARPPSTRRVSDELNKVEIRRVWTANYQVYGARRIYKQLAREGYDVARCTIVRLMADMGIRGVQRGKKRFTTVVDETAVRPADLVKRRFVADRPNQLWLADITYCSTWQGWLYVSFIMDVYSRMIVGWQLADHLRTDLVLDALEMAIWRRDVTCGDVVHHSDRGCQGGFDRSSQHLDGGGVRRWVLVGSRGRRGRCEARCPRLGDRRVGSENSGRGSGSASRREFRARTQRSRSGWHPRLGVGGSVTLGVCDRSVSPLSRAASCRWRNGRRSPSSRVRVVACGISPVK
jgi:putative transposase